MANIYKGDDPMNAKTVPDLLETLFESTDPRVATAICRMPSKRSKAPQLIITVGLVIETNCRLSQCCLMFWFGTIGGFFNVQLSSPGLCDACGEQTGEHESPSQSSRGSGFELLKPEALWVVGGVKSPCHLHRRRW